jgi:hypothetical protein
MDTSTEGISPRTSMMVLAESYDQIERRFSSRLKMVSEMGRTSKLGLTVPE